MSKYFIRLLLLIAAIIGVLLLFEQLLPRSYDFERSAKINAPADEIFPYLDSLKKWPQWSQQFNMQKFQELKLDIKYSGKEEGVGAAQTWTEPRGPGKLWITESNPNEELTYVVEFHGFPQMTSTITLDSTDENTTVVTWHSSGRLPQSPLYGLGAPLFGTQMGYEYEKSLAALKELVEQEVQTE